MEPAKQTRFDAILENLKHLPEAPGCYLMKDKKGKIFYIGKAINLKNRLRSYFTGQDTRPFVSWLSHILCDIETIVVRNEKEALILEHTLVNQHQPKYNILLKDDKNYILLRLKTKPALPNRPLHERYPRLDIVRTAKADGARYFGPFPSATQIRETLHLINKHFQLRNCSDHVIDNRARPCIQYQIGRCPAPCVYDIPSYSDEVANVVAFLSGHTKELESRLKARMWKASREENYELAQTLRDKIDAIQNSMVAQATNKVGRRGNEDAFGIIREGPLVEIGHVVTRHGRTMGTKTYTFDHQEFPSEDILLNLLTQRYQDTSPEHLPSHIFTSLTLPPEAQLLAEELSQRRGSRVRISHPTKSQPRALVDIALKNADYALKDRLRREELHNKALIELQKTLELTKIPKVIECYDVSLFQGTDAVASRVCFVDGVADKSRYRKYNIKTVEGTDDYAMLYETLTRRLKRGLEDKDLPDLLIVDGGKGQLAVALAALKDLKIPVTKDGIYAVGIAKARAKETADEVVNDETLPSGEKKEVLKSSERLFIPGAKDPILLKPHTAQRYLIERIRDEAHRFAITAHRSRRSKRVITSAVEEIKGVGPKRRRALLQHFGSVENIKAATAEAIAKAAGISEKLAGEILAQLGRSGE
jgi:excinuclease ABC subunit C